jgi:hypothetical protein
LLIFNLFFNAYLFFIYQVLKLFLFFCYYFILFFDILDYLLFTYRWNIVIILDTFFPMKLNCLKTKKNRAGLRVQTAAAGGQVVAVAVVEPPVGRPPLVGAASFSSAAAEVVVSAPSRRSSRLQRRQYREVLVVATLLPLQVKGVASSDGGPQSFGGFHYTNIFIL